MDVLCKNSYGWVGFVEADECNSLGQVRDYYKRIGMLIGIVYLLKGNDCHYENLIASGEYPVIIDLESIMHHNGVNMIDESVESAIYQAYEQFGTSVFRTGLLPSWHVGKDDFTFDISGMGAEGKQKTPYQRMRWVEVNTDRMDIRYGKVVSQENVNIPKLNGKRHLPFDYEDEILKGFTTLYRHILEHKDKIPLLAFANKDVRFIFRNTKVYGLINKKLLNPKYMRFGIDRSIQMEMLCRAFLHKEGKTNFWSILKSEIMQMEDFDIPIFTANSSGIDLTTGDDPVLEKFMEEAVYDQVLDRVGQFDKEDLEKQLKFIKASLFFRNLNEAHKGSNEAKMVIDKEKLQPATPKQLTDTADAIAQKIINEAIRSDDGTATWITVGIIPGSEKLQMRPMSINLYDGLSGIALFFGALYKTTGNKTFHEFALASLKSIQKSIEVMKKYQVMISINPIGICTGLSSIVYTLLKMSYFLNDPSIINEAEFIAGKITPKLIQKDKTFDILSGSAGVILAFLQLFEITGKDEYLKTAIICGEHLEKNKTIVAEGMCGWKNIEDKPLAGFSHGNAGTIYSLLKLYEKSHDQRFYQLAYEALTYENSLFYPEQNNWEDIRSYEKYKGTVPRFMTSWCHGAPGIALSRLASKSIIDNEGINKDIDNAISATLNYPLDQVDHLCCGNMGRVETLFFASRVLNDPELERTALKHTSYIIERFGKTGQFKLFHQASGELFHPGFFQGLSGIGYEFLRLAFPDKLPSVLIFE